LELSGADNPGPIAAVALMSAAPQPPAYKDRSTALVVFGIIEIAGGALAALIVPLVLLAAVFGRKASGPGSLAGSALTSLTYLALAVILIILGVGAIQARRWAWALNLILSWIWLVMGIVITVLMVVFVPQGFMVGMRSAAAANPGARPVPPGVMAAILTFFIVCFAVLMVVLPLVFLLFYGSKDVEQTCKARDPVERWTDRRPLPILAFALLCSIGCIYYVLTSFTTPAPFFGRYLTGAPATVFFLVLAIVDGYIAYSFFRLKVAGWWVAVIALLIRIVSALFTFRSASLMQAYSRMGWSQEQLDMLGANPLTRGGFMLGWAILIMILYVGFLFWLKRYFRPASPPGYTDFTTSVTNPVTPGS
jgi:hypothetical protein